MRFNPLTARFELPLRKVAEISKQGLSTVQSSGSATNFIEGEVVSGSGTSWTLAQTPLSGSVKLYANGQRLIETVDYTLAGTTITTFQSWTSGTVLADYRF